MSAPHVVRTASQQELSVVPRARGAYISVLVGPDDGVPNFVTRKFVLEPGGRIPAHKHPDIEHEQVILQGEMHLGLDEEMRLVKPGDAIFIPAGTVHWYENRGEDPVHFLCMVPKTDAYETEWLEVLDDGAD